MKRIYKLVVFVVALACIGVVFFYGQANRELILDRVEEMTEKISALPNEEAAKRELPAPADPKEINFQWQYAGKKFELKKTLYGSIYDFYQKSPKSFQYQGDIPADWEDRYYAMFFQEPSGDDLISQFATDLQVLGEKNKLNENQIVEMILAFVQSIPYDDNKANVILQNGNATVNYPYETLFVQRGVCSDKSILGAAILRKLGYGAALFSYDAEKHMSLGIKCPAQYSNYETGYCYAETTSTGFRIGMIPDFDNNNRAVANREIKPFGESQLEQFNSKRLGEARILQSTDGKAYSGISHTLSLAKEIDSLKSTIQNLGKQIAALKKELENEQGELKDLMEKLDKEKDRENYEAYNNLVPKYNKLADNYEKDVKEYNSMIKEYNQKVARYNSLLKSF